MTAHETNTFKSGKSVALRLPEAFGIGPGTRMTIEQRGDVLTIPPLRLKDPGDEKRKLLELVEALRAIGRPSGGAQERDPFEFPERRGL